MFDRLSDHLLLIDLKSNDEFPKGTYVGSCYIFSIQMEVLRVLPTVKICGGTTLFFRVDIIYSSLTKSLKL
jgi:hypothetical protein